MKKVYITNASMNMIFKSIRFKKHNFSRATIKNDISHDFREYSIINSDILEKTFNTYDLQDIYLIKMIFKDFSKLIDNIKDTKNSILEHIESQNKKYFKKVQTPAYHKNSECEWMKHNFKNIMIPTSCVENIENEKLAREWIENNKKLDFNLLNEQFKLKFNCQEGLELISRDNSGNTEFHNETITLPKLINNIKNTYIQLQFDFDNNESDDMKNLKYIPDYKVNYILEDVKYKNTKEAILKYHNNKKLLKKAMMDYYKIKYNQKLEFDKTILDMLGFRSCQKCSEDKKMMIYKQFHIS
jgi:hypothetical protein